MKLLSCILALASLFVSGCDYIYGVSRGAYTHTLPDLPAVKARIESYPEVKKVKYWEAEGSRPITFTGIKKADEVYYLTYTDENNVHGTLMFERDYKGEVSYSQYLIELNRKPPQAWIDATWPVMLKLENDLIEDFGLSEIRGKVRMTVTGVENPDRLLPITNKAQSRSSTNR